MGIRTSVQPQDSIDECEANIAGEEASFKKTPTLRPPTTSKRQLIPEVSKFSELDNHVKTTPSSCINNLNALFRHLTSQCETDLEKVRAFYCWIAHYITYDTVRFKSGNVPEQTQEANTVLQTGRAVCEGYSNLFLELCRRAQIPCIKINGIAKRSKDQPGNVYTPTTETNHAWNLVYVQGEWRPLDCTWGAGHMDKHGVFQKKFDEHWFLTDPKDFMTDHFPLQDENNPDSSKYQLLKRPLSIEAFSAILKKTSFAHNIDLECITHDKAIIEVKGGVIIRLKAKMKPLLRASVTLKTKHGHKVGSGVMTSISEDGSCTIYVKPPYTGTFLLEVLGQVDEEKVEEEEDPMLHRLLTYVIRCKLARPSKHPLPELESNWGFRRHLASECGLKPNDTFSFKTSNGEVKVPIELTRVTPMLVSLTHAKLTKDYTPYTLIEYAVNRATINLRLPEPGYYKLCVFAGTEDGSETLEQVADLLVYTNKASKAQTFPRTFNSNLQHMVQLIEPRVCQVLAGKRTQYRVQGRGLGKVKVSGQMMEKGRNGVWEGKFVPNRGATKMIISGAEDPEATCLKCLFEFDVKRK